jgi:hypothetical protein
VYRLSLLPLQNVALAKIELLQEVVRFKMRFYRSPWAKYEEAKLGSFRLLPPAHHVPALRRDYAAMRTMLFGAVSTFDEIISGLAALEKSINKLKIDAK